MESPILSLIFIITIFILIGLVIGGLILWGLAKGVGKISNASLGNSFLVSLISSVIYSVIYSLINLAVSYFILKEFQVSFFNYGISFLFPTTFSIVINLLILSVVFISVGKFIWKCQWVKSFKANIIWIIPYAILNEVLLNSFSI